MQRGEFESLVEEPRASINYVLVYPKILLESIVENSTTEHYSKIAFNILIIFFIGLMFFTMFCAMLLLVKLCWMILKAICYWLFARDTVKEYLIKAREEDKQFFSNMMTGLLNEMKGLKTILEKRNNLT
jgi:ABC-type multidrug transport system fused ATPase/permease subunit